jgi:hypothetical protein
LPADVPSPACHHGASLSWTIPWPQDPPVEVTQAFPGLASLQDDCGALLGDLDRPALRLVLGDLQVIGDAVDAASQVG